MALWRTLLTSMAAVNTQDWLVSNVFPWPTQPPVNKIDTHHHWVPPEYVKAVDKAGGDPSGWPTPNWSLHGSELLMGHVGTATAILSITAPGVCIVKDEEESYKLARLLNLKAAAIRDSKPDKFGFFASLGNILHTDAALAEIRYAFDELKADGVTLFTRYGSGSHYLGHPDIEPIWRELDRRAAVVFVHPTHPADTDKINKKLPLSMVDYPHETTRTAMDMLVMGTRQKYPNCKVILSHAGGTLPYVISRIATPLSATNPTLSQVAVGMSYEQVMDGFRSFYYDLALSSSPIVIKNLLEQVPHDHILYGSDFPYAPAPAYQAFLEQLEEFNLTSDLRDKINFGNALALFPRLKRDA